MELSVLERVERVVLVHLVDFKYPLLQIDEIFASLGGATFLLNACNQFGLDDQAQLLSSWSMHINT